MERSKKIINIITLVLCGITIFLTCFKNYSNGDTYFMLNHGRWILNHGLYPQEEMFTMHAGLSFTIQKWLSCLILYGVYLIKGEIALRVFMGICMIIFMFLLKKLLSMISNNQLFVNLFVVAPSMIIATGISPSPRIFTFIFLVLELMCLEKYKKSKDNYKYLIPIPFLTCLCMNTHSTQVIIMFIFMLPYICDISFIKFKNKKLNNLKDKLLIKEDYKRRNIIIIFFISILSLLINPYGFESILYIINCLTFKGYNSIIMELQPAKPLVFIFILLIWMIPFLFYLIYKKKINLIYLYFIIGTNFMFLMHTRNASYLFIAGPLCSIYFLENYFDRFDTKRFNIFSLIVSFIACICLGFLSIKTIRSEFVFCNNRIMSKLAYIGDELDLNIKNYLRTKYPDEDIKDVVQRTKVYIYPSGGSYMEFLGYKSFFDCRSEVFYKVINKKADIQLDYYNLLKGNMNYKDFFKKYPVDFIITTPSGTDAVDIFEDDILNDKDYMLIYWSKIHKVFVPINE